MHASTQDRDSAQPCFALAFAEDHVQVAVASGMVSRAAAACASCDRIAAPVLAECVQAFVVAMSVVVVPRDTVVAFALAEDLDASSDVAAVA